MDTATVTPLNPCIDTDFVKILQLTPTLPEVNYKINQGLLEVVPAHADFVIETSPRETQHSLCGDLTITPTYEGLPIVPGDPVKYGGDECPNLNTFCVEETDSNMEDQVKEYGLCAEFQTWP